MADERAAALRVITEVLENGAFLKPALADAFARETSFSPQERHFITRLVRSTVEKKLLLDDLIGQVSSVKLRKMSPAVRNILRMALCQILFLSSVPDSAAVNEAVKLAKHRGGQRAGGFVNGVLRGYIRAASSDHPPMPRTDEAKYAMPRWIIDSFRQDYGQETAEEILTGLSCVLPVELRINLSKCSASALDSLLTADEFGWHRPDYTEIQGLPDEILQGDGSYVPEFRIIDDLGSSGIAGTEAFRRGLVYAQDLSSALPALYAGLQPGMHVIDVCAAPGGKTFAAADLMQDTGTVDARDISSEKTEKIRENAERMGFHSVHASVRDASVTWQDSVGTADALLCDLPCSGLGIMNRKPDIRYHASPEEITELRALQRRILAASLPYLKEGGRLVFSTCTLTRAENQENTAWLLSEYKDLVLTDEVQILPSSLQGGFYIAAFTRRRS